MAIKKKKYKTTKALLRIPKDPNRQRADDRQVLIREYSAKLQELLRPEQQKGWLSITVNMASKEEIEAITSRAEEVGLSRAALIRLLCESDIQKGGPLRVMTPDGVKLYPKIKRQPAQKTSERTPVRPRAAALA